MRLKKVEFYERKGNMKIWKKFQGQFDVLNRTVYLIENDKLLKSFWYYKLYNLNYIKI